MAKILLVEDDNNLREIYEARLQAEGYTIVSATDGEAALVVAKKEKPDLVISDVMMPRISGFEMLDILRNTEGLKDVKVIMLTALGQAEDKTRADSLGADRYLVKSQVTLEDIVKAAQELLGPAEDSAPSAPQATAAAAEQAAAMAAAVAAPSIPVTAPSTAAPSGAPAPATPPATLAPVAVTPAPSIPVAAPPAAPTNSTPQAPAPTPSAPDTPTPTSTPAPAPATDAPAPNTTPPTPPADTTTPDKPEDQPPAGTPTSTTPPEPPASTPPAPTPTPPPTTEAATPAAPAAPSAPVIPTTDSTPQAPPTVSQPPAPAPEPKQEPASPSPSPSAAQSSSEEEAAIKAQIESFVNQNSQTAPKPAVPQAPAGDTVMADAIKDLVSNTNDQPQAAAPATPRVIIPPSATNTPPAAGTPPGATPPAAEPADDTSDNVSVAHKKVIAPISDPTVDQPMGLDELMAKEGIASLDDEPHLFASNTPTPPTTNPALPSQPGLPTTPHPPGHVISPNNGVDPSSIAL